MAGYILSDSFDKILADSTFNRNITDIYKVSIFGSNLDLDTDVQEDIWNVGGSLVFQTTAQTLSIVSSSLLDTAGGTGARNVIVTGLDVNYNALAEVVTLNGTVPVVTVGQYLRVTELRCGSVGSLNVNQGSITATYTTTLNTAARADAGRGQSLMTHWTIPSGFTGFLMSAEEAVYKDLGFLGGTSGAVIRSWVKTPGNSLRITFETGLLNSTIQFTAKVPVSFVEKTDIYYTATASGDDTSVSVRYDLLLVSNEYLRHVN